MESIQNKGLRLIATAKQKNQIANELRDHQITPAVINVDERAKLLITLLRTKKPISISDLSEIMHYSKTPILSKLNSISGYISEFSCNLVKRTNSGVELCGLERNKRAIYLDIIKNLSLNELNDLFAKDTVDKVFQIVHTTELNLNSQFCSYDYRRLANILLVQIDRLQFNHTLDDSLSLGTEIQEYYVSLIIKMQIENCFMLSLPQREVFEIEKDLLSVRKQVNTQLVVHFDEKILDHFIDLLSKSLNVDLTHDMQLKQSLISHLKPAIRRLKYGISTDNPLIMKIKDKYTEIYLSIMTAIETIEDTEDICFDSNEIGYICLHIVAAVNRSEQIRTIETILICDAGLTFESYLKSLIECTFAEIKIVAIMNPEIFSESESSVCHSLVLNSTSRTIINKNVINIDTLLNEDSSASIRHWLFARELSEKNTLRMQFKDIIQFFNDDSPSQEIFIEKYCAFLINNSYVNTQYKNSVLERMSKSATAIGRGIAVPHGAKSCVIKSTILIVKLVSPIKWEDQIVDFIFFAVIGNDISNEYSKIFRRIGKIVSDDNLTIKLKNCTTIDELENILLT